MLAHLLKVTVDHPAMRLYIHPATLYGVWSAIREATSFAQASSDGQRRLEDFIRKHFDLPQSCSFQYELPRRLLKPCEPSN